MSHTGFWRNLAGMVTSLGLLMVLAWLLVACNPLPPTPEVASPTEEPPATAAPAPTETRNPAITYLTFWEPFALDRPQGLLLGEMVRAFESEYPTISIELIPKEGYGGLHYAMLDQLAAGPEGELPTLAVAFPGMIAHYAAAGVLAPLDLYLDDPQLGLSEEDRADIYPNLLEMGRLPGQPRPLWSFPFVQNAVGLWVNESLLGQAGWDRPPATWDEFERACFDLYALNGSPCYPFIESVTTFEAWLNSRGGRLLDETGRRAAFNEAAGVESLALLRRLIDAGLARPPEMTFGDYVAFANGQAAFTFASTGSGDLYAQAYEAAVHKGMEPFQWRQVMIPQADPANPATVLYGANFFIVRGEPEKEKAAWLFIRWFTARDQTARWAATLETLPVRASALEVMTDTLETYPFVRAQVEDILPYGRPEPAIPEAFEVRDILHTAILSVTQGYTDPQAALDQAAGQVNTLLGSGHQAP
ncbi:MAG TPA: extracellular solute-binding protein [Anaerolineae bacterium]|nr:extracellular solute-binding protein [Anaerolineae bacterium]